MFERLRWTIPMVVALATTDALADGPAMPDCKALGLKAGVPALFVDYEYCAMDHFGFSKSEQARAALKKDVLPHAYSVPFDKIADPVLKKRAAEVLGSSGKNVVSIVANPRAWIPADIEPAGKVVEAGTGGPKAWQQVVLRCMIGADRGHYELSLTAASTANLSPAAVKIVADASIEPDEYEWGNPAAHGQADLGGAGVTSRQAKDQATRKFREWIARLAKRASESSACGKPGDAAYFLGYLLHATQDLSTHQGMTNAEHSYQSSYVTNPDADGANLDRALRWSQSVLGKFRGKLTEAQKKALRELNQPAVTVRGEFGIKDGDANELWKFWRLGKQYKSALGARKADVKYWFDNANAETFFTQNVLDVIESNFATACPKAP